MKKTMRVMFALLVLFACLSMLSPVGLAVRARNERTIPSNIRITPPAPAFDDKERLAELKQRRERVAQSLGPQSFMILFSTEPRVYANDVDYPYRQENNLYYLTNLKQKSATLVLLPGNTKVREILFMPRRNPSMETWTGHMYSAEEANQLSGIREIWHVSEFDPFIKALRNRQPYRPKPENIFMSDLPKDMPLTNDHGYTSLFDAAAKGEAGLFMLMPGQGESREYKQEQYQECMAHLYPDASCEVADGTASASARDRYQHRSAPARVGGCRGSKVGIRSRCSDGVHVQTAQC